MGIILPKPNEIVKANLINPRVTVIYSEPKVGKTELTAKLKDSLLIDLENAAGYVDATKITVRNLEELVDVGREIIKQKFPYKYIILDTATELESWCEADATEMYKNSVIGKSFKGDSVLELPKGAGYYWLRKSYGTYFKSVASWAEHLILLAHVRDKMLVDKKGKEVEASDLDLTGKLKQITCSRADAIGYMYRKNSGAENGKPIEDVMISFRASGVTAGSRAKHLIGNDIVLSRIVPQGEPIVANWEKVFLPEEK